MLFAGKNLNKILSEIFERRFYKNGETIREKTSAGDSLDALDKFSAAFDDDLEWDFDLLGERSLRLENFRLRTFSLFPDWIL